VSRRSKECAKCWWAEVLRRCEMRFCAWVSAVRRVDGEAAERALGLRGVNSGSVGAGGGGERGVCGAVKEDVAEVKNADGESLEGVRGAVKEDEDGGVGVRGKRFPEEGEEETCGVGIVRGTVMARVVGRKSW